MEKIDHETGGPVITTAEASDKLRRNIGILAMIGLSMSSRSKIAPFGWRLIDHSL